MRFEVHAPATNGDDRALVKLTEILTRVDDGLHTLVFEAPETLEQSRWFQHIVTFQQDIVRRSILADTYPSTPCSPTTTCTIKDPEDVYHARDLAYTPLTILVENEFSDGALIHAAVEAYASPEVKATWARGQKVQSRGWIFAAPSGTGQLPKKIDDLCSGQRNTRVLVVSDSDEDLPRRLRPPKSSKRSGKIQAAARRHHVRCFILPIREIENYLPDAFWDAWLAESLFRKKYTPTIEALKQLSPDQRDYIDMEGERRLKPGATLGPLFDGSDPKNPAPSASTIAALTASGTKNLKQRYEPTSTENRPANIWLLPDYIVAGKVTRADLSRRDRKRSLRKLVNLLSELL